MFPYLGALLSMRLRQGGRVLDVTDKRANLMSTEKVIDEGSVDRYDFIKNSYEQNRKYLIHDGNPPDDNDPDLLDESSEESDNASKETETDKFNTR